MHDHYDQLFGLIRRKASNAAEWKSGHDPQGHARGSNRWPHAVPSVRDVPYCGSFCSGFPAGIAAQRAREGLAARFPFVDMGRRRRVSFSALQRYRRPQHCPRWSQSGGIERRLKQPAFQHVPCGHLLASRRLAVGSGTRKDSWRIDERNRPGRQPLQEVISVEATNHVFRPWQPVVGSGSAGNWIR